MVLKLRVVCGKLQCFEDQCNLVLDNMQRQIEDIEGNNKQFMTQSKSRNKRAPLEFIGSLYHILLGIMDADDREQMKENMVNLLSNQHNQDKLIKRQTSVIDSTANILKELQKK